PTHAITQGVVSPRFMRFSGRLYFVVGVAIGSVIGLERGGLFVATGIAGALAAYFYTGARFSFKYVALGDVLVFFLMGPVLVAIGVWALAGSVPAEVWALSLPVAFLVTAILHGNNLRDRDSDRAAGVRTVANLVSERVARIGFAGLIGAAYLTLVVLLASGVAPVWSALALPTVVVAAPLAVRVQRGERDLVALPVSCAKLHLMFSLPYLAAFAVAALLT
ncbi:MAG: prenyltransferase, partial [Spirochaetaceae bacterium]